MGRHLLNLLFLLMVIFYFSSTGESSQKGSGESRKEHISSPAERLREIEEKIKSYEERLKSEKAKEFSVLSEMNELTRRLNILRARISDLKKRLRMTENNILMTEREMKSIKENIDKRRNYLKIKLRNISRYGYLKEMNFLFQASDTGELLRYLRYLEMLSDYERRMIQRFREDMDALEKKGIELKALKDTEKKTLESIKAEEREVLLKQREKTYLLAYVKNKKDFYEKMIRELNESRRELERIIKESERFEEKDTGFLSKRGRLIWPVRGRLKVPYGYHKDPDTGVPVFRSGIHIMTDEDDVKAVYKGKVAYVGELKGYGKVIILSHGGNYHSVYANLSEIFFKQGDIILEGQSIGRTGESEILEGRGLYFEIRYKGKPLDPMQWLRRR